MEVQKTYSPFSEQVAGSFPLLSRNDGKICKPATKNEHRFYSKIIDKSPALKPFTAKFFGEVAIPTTADSQEHPRMAQTPLAAKAEKKKTKLISAAKSPNKKEIGSWSYNRLVRKMEKRNKKVLKDVSTPESSQGKFDPNAFVYLVLENLTNDLDYPHVLDLKIGTQQHGSHESEAKKLSKSKKCKTTTSSVAGVRVCGLQMFDTNKREVRKDKYWGRDLDFADLTQVIQMFVSYCPDFYDLPCSKNSTTDVEEDVSHRKVRREVVESLIHQIEEVIDIVKSLNWRFFGSSALITFSGGPSKGTEHEPLFRIIDFANAEIDQHEGYDKGFVFGLENLQKILVETLSLMDTRSLKNI